jgi:hypothetical protein
MLLPSTLNMDAGYSSETLEPTFPTTRCHNTKGHNLNLRFFENCNHVNILYVFLCVQLNERVCRKRMQSSRHVTAS